MNTLAVENLGVVIVDDDPIFRDLICMSVERKSSFAMFQAASEMALHEVLGQQRIDCIVMDYDLGEDNGLAIKKRLDEVNPEHPPTIIITGDGRESTAIRAFRMGVGDYLPKRSLSPEMLVDSVLRVVRDHRDNVSHQIEYRRLMAASAIDIVTGVEGRLRLDERLALLASLPSRTRAFYEVIAVDMVEHRFLSERFGLKVADQALRIFGKRLQGAIRSNDVCGRYLEGTFLIIADIRSGGDTVEQICRRLVSELSLDFRFAAVSLTLSAKAEPFYARKADGDRDGRAETDAAVAVQLGRASPAGPPEPTDSPVQGHGATLSDLRPAADELSPSDRRIVQRQRIFKRGLIHLLGSSGTINCTVRNVSATGAGLRIESPFAVPSTFDLEIAGSNRPQRVRVKWQNAVNIGVEFVAPPSP